MAYSMVLMRIWKLVPKWLLVALATYVFGYYTGVGHGRAPFETAQKVRDAQQVLIVRHSKTDISTIKQQSEQANETTKNNECMLGADDADGLSDIRTN
ncbi:MAG: hypothetical protein HRU29_11705 [Rhizobiales bacterium]|nr:hypothetical protein [Hyphomicrobiales bacterium]NRB15055.1 hypothetical protein [Hyphomicrobiales bacterium]